MITRDDVDRLIPGKTIVRSIKTGQTAYVKNVGKKKGLHLKRFVDGNCSFSWGSKLLIGFEIVE